jgi:hypothetical protein
MGFAINDNLTAFTSYNSPEIYYALHQRGLSKMSIKSPTIVFFLDPTKPLSSYD